MSKPETMMIDDVKYVREDSIKENTVFIPMPSDYQHPAIGKYCVIRTYSAGVHIGTVQAVQDKNVTLSNSRRLYQWSGAFTLSAVAEKGITDGKVACVVPVLFLTEAIEIIPCSSISETCIKNFKEHTP